MPAIFALAVIVFLVATIHDFFSSLLDAIGGWPGLIAIVVGILALFFAIGHFSARKEDLEELKSMPGRVRALVEGAQKLFGEAATSLKHAEVQFEERRAPVFWDKIDECEGKIMQCVGNLESAQGLIEKYNDRAPARELANPAQLEQLPPAAYDDTKALFDEMTNCSYKAMAISEFGVVYEQRRQAKLIVEQQDRIRAEMQSKLNALETKTREAIAIADRAASKAESAKRISKSARGDWF